jgi:prepilin signal peptidase PulO-like enzyme (type II secretory pathway)
METFGKILIDCLLVSLLVLIARHDAKTSLIPDRYNFALAVLALFSWLTPMGISPADGIIGSLAVSFPMLLLSLIRFGSVGGGDIKLMAAAGLLLGWQKVLIAASAGIMGAGCYAVVLLASRKAGMKDRFAFGPFLCLGITLAWFYGDLIIQRLYLGL